MNRTFPLIIALTFSPAAAQIQDLPADEPEPEPRYSFGISGSISFVDPKKLNDGIHFINTTLDLNVPRVNTVLSGTGFFRMWLNPRLFAVLKGEYIGFSRAFEYQSTVTSGSSSGTSSFLVKNERRYAIYPLGLGIGFSLAENSSFETELGFHYAFAVIKESGSMEGYGSYSSDYDGRGFGAWMLLRPSIRMTDHVSLAPELTGRLLIINDFMDQRGRESRGFDVNLTSISFGLSLVVTL